MSEKTADMIEYVCQVEIEDLSLGTQRGHPTSGAGMGGVSRQVDGFEIVSHTVLAQNGESAYAAFPQSFSVVVYCSGTVS